MEENNLTMADLMAEIDQSMTHIYRGQVLKAKVVLVQEDGVIVNIGYHADGIVPWNEMSYEDIDKSSIKEDDEFDVVVLKIDDGDGNVVVSRTKAESQAHVEEIEKMLEEKQTFTVRIKEAVKGGVIAPFKGFRAFIPGSQISHVYVGDLTEYVGKDVEVEIIEFVPKSKKLVLSGKRLSGEKAKVEKVARLQELSVGATLQGKVTKLMPYGAFVSIGGVEGLIHNSDLAWGRVKHPSDVVKEGDQVEVSVLSVDVENGKVALSLKDMTTDPWIAATANLEEGQVVSVTITRFASFGAFAKLSENVEGLIHISQMSDKRIAKAEEVLEIGQEVKAKIVKVDREAKKLALTLKDVEAKVSEDLSEYMQVGEEKTTVGDILGGTL